jgi:hypothetical protein
MIIVIDMHVLPEADTLENSGYQPGSATVVADFQARCGRRSRISAEPIRSVTDGSMENSKK